MATVHKRSSDGLAVSSISRAMLRWAAATETAVVLMLILAMVLALVSIFEGVWGRAAAERFAYHSWWFVALFGLLGLNTLSGVLVRFPWRRDQVGFLLTHVGVLALLVGMGQSLVGGVEGQVTLKEGAARHRIRVRNPSQRKPTRIDGGTPRESTTGLLELGYSLELIEFQHSE